MPEKKKKATKGKKKKAGDDKPKEPVEPTVSMLYQMRFDRQKINIPLIEKIRKDDPAAFHK